MKILAIIPARAGSKRIPGKNIKDLGGKPLIAWSIEVTFGIEDIVDCVVSTDSQEIANIAKEYGAMVPGLRPEELSTDTSSTIDVLLHVVESYQKIKGTVDGVLLLQPTTPFRKMENIQSGIKKFKEHGKQFSVISFSHLDFHPYWSFKEEGGFLKPFFSYEELKIRSQDLPKAYRLNGNLYLIPTDWLISKKSLYTESVLPLIIESRGESIDIDTMDDWLEAENFLLQNEV